MSQREDTPPTFGRGTVLVLSLLLPAAAARAGEEPESLRVARLILDEHRGEAHAEKMRVLWPAIEDETPPDGAEVVMVRGYMSHEITRFVLRDGKVDAGSVAAERSWFHNQKDGESFQAYSFDVDAGRFVVAWNAMRRILGASDERIEPEPEDHPDELHFLSGSHESADWIRARAAAEVHCADRPSASFDWDGVRLWDGLRDRAIFELFRALIPEDARRAASLASWADFAAAEVRAAAKALDVDRDHELVETCVRILGVAGATGAADDVAALDATLPDLDDYRVRSLREETTRAATRLRVRHHWDRDDVVRTLRAIPPGTWADEDQGRWLRGLFREKDPEGWAAFLLEETTRKGARPDDVAIATVHLKELPAADAVPVLRRLLEREDPYIRLEAAITLRAFLPEDDAAKEAVVTLALDRSIACEWRLDLTNRWSRKRALDVALEWGGLTPADLRAHFLAPEPEDPVLLKAATARLANTPEALTNEEIRPVWRRLLDSPMADRVVAAVRFLVDAGDAASRERMLAALDRLDARIAAAGPDAVGVRANTVADLRAQVQELAD